MPGSERKTRTTQIFTEYYDMLLLGVEGWGAEEWKWTVMGKISQIITFHKSLGENKIKIPFMVECLREQLSIVLTHKGESRTIVSKLVVGGDHIMGHSMTE